MPTYTVSGEKGEASQEIGKVEGSSSLQFGSAPKKNYDNEIMRTKDIDGAQASTKGLGIFANTKRRELIKNSLDNTDVLGAHVGSLKKGP